MNFKIFSGRAWLLLPGLILCSAFLLHFALSGLTQGSLRSGNANVFVSFGDVPSTHPNSAAIQYVQTQQIVEGYPDGSFRPDDLMNRAEFTKIITEAYYPGQAAGSGCFPDVGTEWFAKYVCFDKAHSIIAGYPDGKFRPADTINFAEIAKILVNVKGLLVTQDLNFWYKPYVEKLAELHAIPSSITSFAQKVTRGEMAEMVYRLRAGVTNQPSKTYEQLAYELSTPGLPVRLNIPGIHVDSAVEYVGLTPQGAVGIPKDPDNAAWYNLGPRPGEIGSAVITGHINWYYGAIGVFADLHKVKPGDRIVVRDDKGVDISFVVRETRSYDAAAQAIDVFISNDGKAHLNLITCEGVWDSGSQQYTKRLVVFADKEV